MYDKGGVNTFFKVPIQEVNNLRYSLFKPYKSLKAVEINTYDVSLNETQNYNVFFEDGRGSRKLRQISCVNYCLSQTPVVYAPHSQRLWRYALRPLLALAGIFVCFWTQA